MIRTLLAAALGMLLAGCWQSEEQLFGASDWANLDLDGEYLLDSEPGMLGMREVREVTLTRREDGLIQSVTEAEEEGAAPEIGLFGLVPIPGGSGRFFLAVDRSSDTGETYLIARLGYDDALALYAPSCEGTSARNGLVIEDASKGGQICTFASRQALLDTALEAEQFLSARHVIAILPVMTISEAPQEVEPPAEEARQ